MKYPYVAYIHLDDSEQGYSTCQPYSGTKAGRSDSKKTLLSDEKRDFTQPT